MRSMNQEMTVLCNRLRKRMGSYSAVARRLGITPRALRRIRAGANPGRSLLELARIIAGQEEAKAA